jgi:acetyl esterase/lipase
MTLVDETRLVHRPFSIAKLFRIASKIPFRRFTYVTYDDISLTLDFHASLVHGRRPCVLVIHGGSWVTGNSQQFPQLNCYLAQAGFHVASINYRLAPRWQCPAPIDDTTAALRYLCENANELNIDSDKFVLLGRSAGGQIALLTAYARRQSNVKGVINFYGPADMVWGYMTPSNPLVLNARQTLATYIADDYDRMPDKYVASSPIEFVDGDSVPTLILHGRIDSLVFTGHGHRLADKLRQYDVPHYFLELPWATHSFDYHPNGPGGQLSTFAIEYFLRSVVDS